MDNVNTKLGELKTGSTQLQTNLTEIKNSINSVCSPNPGKCPGYQADDYDTKADFSSVSETVYIYFKSSMYIIGIIILVYQIQIQMRIFVNIERASYLSFLKIQKKVINFYYYFQVKKLNVELS